eukprot:scaffold1953_cov391-Prasinococcus_capsulatus_cf.AAC.7
MDTLVARVTAGAECRHRRPNMLQSSHASKRTIVHTCTHKHTYTCSHETLHTALPTRGDGQALLVDGHSPRTGQPRQDPRFRVLLRDGYDKEHILAMEGAHKAAFRALLYQSEGLTTQDPGTTPSLCNDERWHQHKKSGTACIP